MYVSRIRMEEVMGLRGRCRLDMFRHTLLIAWAGTVLLGCCSCTINSRKVEAYPSQKWMSAPILLLLFEDLKQPSRTVTAQSQRKNSTGFYSKSLGSISAPGRGSSHSYTHMHTHGDTQAGTWSFLLVLMVSYHPCITPDKKQANFLSTLLWGEQRMF